MKYVTLFFLLGLFFHNCNNSTSVDSSLKEKLVEWFISSKDLDFTKNKEGRLVVLKDDYCKEENCEQYFKAYSTAFTFYSREDIFMRAIKNYIVIQDINEQRGEIKIKKVNGKQIEMASFFAL